MAKWIRTNWQQAGGVVRSGNFVPLNDKDKTFTPITVETGPKAQPPYKVLGPVCSN